MKENNINEPRPWILRALEWFCPAQLFESIEGDLLESFEEDVEQAGQTIARRRLAWNALGFFRPGILLRNRFSYRLINTIMLRNYLTVAFRNVLRSKVFSAINVFGLGIGLAACLLIIQFVSFELSYDTFNEKMDRTYRVTNDRFQNGKLIQHGTIMYPTIGPAMVRDFPEVEEYTRMMPSGLMSVSVSDKVFRDDNALYADEHFFSVFSYTWLSGQRSSALKDPYSLVLTASTARKYFNGDATDFSAILGKTLYSGLDPRPYKITGVCEDFPENSHLRFNILVSYATLITPDHHDADDSWTWSDMRHYLVLKPGTDYKKLESKFEDFSERHFKGDKVSGSVEKFYLQPLKDAHLYSDYEYDIARTASGEAVWAMLVVAGIILMLAWINYVNLTTSRSLNRAKEVGLRKVMGAVKAQLIWQFIFESILVSAFAFLVAIVVVQLLQGPFNEIVGGNFSLWQVLADLDVFAIAVLIAIMAAGVLLSGFYPAFVLSSYQPVTVLRGKFQRSSGGTFLRKGLVIFQFTASAALVTGTLIVSKQLRYMNEADMGINLHHTMVVDPPERTIEDSTFIDRVTSFKSEIAQLNGVMAVSTSNQLPGRRLGRTFGVALKQEGSGAHYTMSFYPVDYDFFNSYNVRIVAGRNFLPTDHHINWDNIHVLVVNEQAVKLLGLKDPQEIVGQVLRVWDRDWDVIGVVNDFHQESMKKPMEPIIFFPTYGAYQSTSIKFEGDVSKEAITSVEATYHKFFPGNAFLYSFIEDRYKQQYRDDNRFNTIINIFTVLAIMISCLGLIGLSSYTVVQRTKEIGIRKVLGASIVSVVSMLSADFIKLVLLAVLLSLPIAYFTMEDWLQGYAYRIALGWALFVIPLVLIMLIAGLTISFQVLRTAMTNPAETLKYE